MTKPVTIPNTFATATTAIPLSQLDSDFSTVATALNDANTYSNYAADTGVANAYVVTLSGVSTTYSAGLRIQFKAGAANTGASTLNVNGGGTKNITFQDASALSSGTIAANAIVDVMYDGTQFLLMNDPAGATGGDVVGPAGATANAAAIFDSTTGKLIKDSKVIITPVANSSTLTIANNKTVTVNNTLTLSGTDSTTMTFPSTSATIARTDSAQTFTGVQTFSSNPILSGGTANGVLYLNGSSVATSGSALTFDGTNLSVGTPALSGGKFSTLADLTAVNGLVVRDSATTYANNNNYVLLQNSAGATAGALTHPASASMGVWGNDDIRFLQGSPPTEQMRLTSTGLKSSIAGTNADPVFSYTSDTNTGIFFPATDKLGFTAGGGTDDMVLTTTGLGIGTSSPSFKQHTVVSGATGDIAGFGLTGNTNNPTLLIKADATNQVITFRGGSSTSTYPAIAFDTGTGGEKMRLDSSGNLGLGVTPSASNTYPTFELANIGAVGFKGQFGNFSANAYFNSGLWKYATSTGRALLHQFDDGAYKWFTAPSGTAGNAITFTQAMTLDASGRLGIGTTSPTQLLDIRGNTGSNIGQLIKNDGAGRAILELDAGGTSSAYLQFKNQGTQTARVEVDNSSNLSFSTGSSNTERARITSGGYFKASNNGTYQNSAAAYHELRQSASDWIAYIVNSNATPYGINLGHITDANSTGSPFLACNAGAALGTLRAEIRSNGGLANYQSNNVDLSDIRTKTDINPVASYWNKIAALEIVSYKYKDQTHDDLNIGVIAQQVEQVAPEFVDADGFGETPEDGVPLKTVYTKDITFAAIKALQEAMARIETLEAKVSALEGN